MHGVQLLQVAVEAEGLYVELQRTHRVLNTKGRQRLGVHNAKDTNLFVWEIVVD